ncbi:DNA-binding protein [Dyella sp. ASV21]|uniref:DNA-binding protein n=1 Tax=Dyella sp. ASV21 TaxID=2795114 RepID=UPI0018EBFE8B|nr:DNA-binding protein [Dyella sp. ASV21]
MANGVPEHEVFKAADAVLARGERPTVERVRTELGRGSPARVGQLLEQWWEQLAMRLKGHALLPELPGEVAQAFAEAWRLALSHAGTTAEAALTEQQNTLFAAQTELTQERKLWEIALAAVQGELAEGASKLAQAELQLAERQGLLEQLAADVTDVRQQRDRLQGELQRRQSELEGLRAEHAAMQAHIRTVEDRAHQQVDQARQELKALGQQQERARREHAKQVAEFTTQRDALQAVVRTAEQAAAHQAGQVTALEATIAQWRRTPASAPPARRKSAKATGKSTTRQRRS